MSLRSALTRAASPVSAFVPVEQRPPRWQTAIHVAVALMWVLSLTLWYFYQYLYFLHTDGYEVRGTLGTATAVLRHIGPLWLTSFCPALAFGIGWFVFSTVFAERRHLPPPRSKRPPWPVAALGCLSVAICLNLLVWRITPIPILVGLGAYNSGTVLDDFHQAGFGDGSFPIFGRLLFIGAAGAVVVSLQAWGAMRRGGRGPLVGVSILALIFGMSVFFLDLYRYLPSPVPRALFDLRQESDLFRKFLDSDDPLSPDLQLLARCYFGTHDGQGRPVSLRHIRASDRSRGIEACETCLLPITILATLDGITLDLDVEKPTTLDPRVVLEVPLSGEEIRIYEPGEDSSYRTISVPELAGQELADWLILKLDSGLHVSLVVSLLEHLDQIGVKRVSLAAYPFEYALPPADPPSLIIGRRPELPVFAPQRVSARRTPVFVRLYVPPPGSAAPRRCYGPDRWELYLDREWAIPDPGSVPDEVTIASPPRRKYHELLVHLDRAIAGGARTIYLNLSDDARE